MDFISTLNNWGSEHKAFYFIIDFEKRKPRAWLLDEHQDSFLLKFNDKTFGDHNYLLKSNRKELIENFQTSFRKYPISLENYEKKFNRVKAAIQRGDSFLINLTIPTQVEHDLDFETYFEYAKSKYVIWLKNEFICFSPETFVKIRDGKIATYPMKGTIDASIENAKELILNDPKEHAEHATIVDLLRNDLSKVATKVKVNKFRYYEVVKTNEGEIGQVSSEIEGELPEDYEANIGSIIFDLLPAGSVSGAPKKKTLSLISEIEGEERGYYTGIAGYFDGHNLDSCVLIRFLQSNNIYRSGGGITYQSDMVSEYEEMINKVYVPIF